MNVLPWQKGSEPLNVAVVGDVMLDEYLEGEVANISPEAPVLVHKVSRSRYVPGGAANAAHNIQAVGAQAHLFSITGSDGSYEILSHLCKQAGINTSALLSVGGSTIKKTRVITRSQQLMRIDWEKPLRYQESQRKQLLAALKDLSFQGLLISDYGKGLLSADFCMELIALAQERGVPVVVDPSRQATSYHQFRHANLVKPNYKEACHVLGLPESPEKLGPSLAHKIFHHHRHHNPQYSLLITLGERGMVYAHKDGTVVEEKQVSKEVYDVSGAGDTVAAVAGLALCSQLSWPETLKLASLAAGIVIEKMGTQPVYAHELLERLSPSLPSVSISSPEALSWQEALEVRQKLQKEGKTVVMAGGCFDLLHVGHLRYLKAARLLADYLFVALNSDDSIMRLKGKERPITVQSERCEMLLTLRWVDGVVVFAEDNPLKLIEVLKPDVFVKGEDWALEDIVEREAVQAYGGQLRRVPLVQGRSSTQIISTITQRHGVEAVAKGGIEPPTSGL